MNTHGNARYWQKIIIAAAPVVVFSIMIWHVRWIGDDGLINTRVVYNILDGRGPVYNDGERVEAFTSPLWIAILAALGRVGFRPDTTSVYLGLIFSSLGMIFGILAAHRMNKYDGNTHGVALPLGMLVYSVLPPSWDYGTSGLETGLSLAWMAGSYLYLVVLTAKEPQNIQYSTLLRFGAILGLGPLIRPEMSLFCAGTILSVVAVLSVSRKETNRRPLRILSEIAILGLSFILFPLAYQIFRMGYFAALTSNTAIAKEAFLSYWEQGWFYFANFFGLYHLYIPLAFLAILHFTGHSHLRSRSRKIIDLCMFASSVAYILYVVKVGGDFMHGRFFLPGFFGLLLPVSTMDIDIARIQGKARIVVPMSIFFVVGWSVFCFAFIRMPIENQNGIGDERGWYTRRAITSNPVTLEEYKKFSAYKDAKEIVEKISKDCSRESDGCCRWVLIDKPQYGKLNRDKNQIPINDCADPSSTKLVVMRGGIGIFGAVAGPEVHVVDVYGLLDPIGSRLSLNGRGRPGHEKAFTNVWLVARFADLSSALVHDKSVKTAFEALNCTPLPELMDAVTAPMSLNRFLLNIRNSFLFQKIRIPRDPNAAAEKFCLDE